MKKKKSQSAQRRLYWEHEESEAAPSAIDYSDDARYCKATQDKHGKSK